MREQPVPLRVWLRRDLTQRFGNVLAEDIPAEMLALLPVHEAHD